MLLVPYQGKKGDYAIKPIKKRMKSLLLTGIVTKIAYVDNKLSVCFRVKDITKFKHNHDRIYQDRCFKTACDDYYLGETSSRLPKRVLNLAGKDPDSYLFKNSMESGQPVLNMSSYQVIRKRFKNNARKRKFA